jgi:Domain of unknown function (DUF4926)
MIEELDRVALTRALPEYGLVPGDIGAVVAVHQGGRGVTVEFMALDGRSIAVVTLAAHDVRELRAREVAHVRERV